MVTSVSAESKWHPAPEVHGLVARPVFTINSTGLGIGLLIPLSHVEETCTKNLHICHDFLSEFFLKYKFLAGLQSTDLNFSHSSTYHQFYIGKLVKMAIIVVIAVVFG